MWIAATSFVLVLGGLLLLAFALRAKRVGTEPHCRRCEYNLTGSVLRTGSAAATAAASPARGTAAAEFSTFALCPECGTAISRRTVKRGEKRRRVLMPILAVLILGIGLAGIYASFDHRRWVRQYPFPVVLTMAKFGNMPALAELQRRYTKSELSPSAERRLIETALNKQRSLLTPWEKYEWMNVLEQLQQGDSLSNEQTDLYWAQTFHYAELIPRRRYRVGEELVVGLAVDLRMAMPQVRIIGERARSKLLEKIRNMPQGTRARPLDDPGMADFLPLLFPHRFVQAGKDDILIRANLEMEGRFWEGGAKVRKKVEVTAAVEVVPADYVDTFIEVRNPSLQTELESLLVVIDQAFSDSFENPAWVLQPHILARQPLPCSLAADVFLEKDEAAEHLGTVYGWKGSRLVVSDLVPLEHARFGGSQLSLVLQFNPEVAQKTVDLGEVFSGELRLKPVKVRVLAPPG